MQWDNNRTNFDRNLAVVIGIDRYDSRGIHDLQTAVSDANAIANLLRDEYGYKDEHIVRLFSPKNDEATLKALHQPYCPATLKELRILLTDTLSNHLKPTPADRLLFYFAGHGIPRNSKDGPAGYLVPQTAEQGNPDSFLSMRELHDALSKLECHHLLVILDCCFAGTFRWASSRKAIPILETVHKEHYDRFIRYPAWQVLTSAAHDQEALDLSIDQRGSAIKDTRHSPFALALIEGLRDNKADVIQDKVITAHELYLYLDRRVNELSREMQTPGIYPMRLDCDKGEYIFTRPGFNRDDDLEDAPRLNEENNPYRGLKPFEQRHSRFFFGRKALVEALSHRLAQSRRPLTVVLGASGSGKSSLVKAGLLPYLREKQKKEQQAQRWYILDPMRPGKSPFRELARTVLPVANSKLIAQLAQVSFLDKAFAEILDPNSEQKQKAASPNPTQLDSREQPSGDEAFDATKLAECWNHAEPEAKLLLVVDYFAQLQRFCHQPQEQEQLSSLYRAIEQTFNRLTQSLQQEPQSFTDLMATWSQVNPSTKLLLVIDQFEELITMSQDDRGSGEQSDSQEQDEQKEWQRFLSLLRLALAKYRRQLHIVLTLRSDFEPRFLNSALKVHWKNARFPVRAMNSDELRDAIEGPALKQALYFEPPELVGKLIDEVGQMPGALPLLSFTLSELYIKLHDRWAKDNATDRALRIKDYEELGGVAGALTRRATEEYDNLVRKFGEESGKAYQATMRRVMLRMVAIEGGGVARRRVPESELVYPDSEENKRVAQVSDRLVKARLLVKGQEIGEPYVEPAHDFLVCGWDKLQGWLKEEQEILALRQRLTVAACAWIRREGSLWVEEADRLIKLNEVINSNNSWLNRLETAFVKRSSKIRQDRIKKLEEDLRISEERRVKAELREKVARVESLLPVQPLDGVTLAIAAIGQNIKELPNNILSSVQSSLRKAMSVARERNSFKAHEGIVEHVGFSPEGKQVISRSYSFRAKDSNSYIDNLLEQIPVGFVTQDKYDEIVRLWSKEGSCTNELLKDENHRFLSFTSDGQEIVTVSSEGFLYLWALDGSLLDNFFIGNIDLSPSINSTTVSTSNRQYIVSGNDDGTIHLWELPSQQNSESKLTVLAFQAHQAGISSIILSSDGQQIASGSVDGMIGIWDLQGNPLIDQICGHKNQVLAIAISLDNQHIVSGSTDGSICIFDVKNKRAQSFKLCEAEILSIAFSFDGKQIVIGTNDGIIYVRSVKGRPITKLVLGYKKKVSFVAFNSLDGIEERLKSKNAFLDMTFVILAGWITENSAIKNAQNFNPLHKISTFRKQRIVVGSVDGIIQIWDLNGNPIGKPFIGYTSRLSIGFSPDARQIVALSDGKLRSWDLEGNLIKEAFNRHKDGVLSAAFSPNRQMIVSGGNDGTVCLWDGWGNLINQLLKGNEYASIPNQDMIGGVEGLGIRAVEARNFKNKIKTLSFSRDGQKIVSGSYNGTIHIWDAETELICSFETLKAKVGTVTFSTDGQQVIASSVHGKIHTWNLQKELIHESLLKLPSGLFYEIEQPIAFSSDRHQIVGGGREWVCLWNINSKLINNLFNYSSYDPFGPSDTLSVAFSPDERWIVSGSSDGVARLWNLNGELTVKILRGYTGLALAFSPDSQRLAGSSYDKTIRLWDINGNPIGEPLRGHQAAVSSIAFSPDGKIVSGGENGTLHLWDSEGKPIGEPFFGHVGKILSVAFSSDGKSIVSGSEDKTIRLWDINGNPIGEPLRGHQAAVSSVAFSPDRQLIVSGSHDKTVRLWQAGTWENWLQVCCERLRHHSAFRNPEQIGNLEQRQIAIKACETCQKYIW